MSRPLCVDCGCMLIPGEETQCLTCWRASTSCVKCGAGPAPYDYEGDSFCAACFDALPEINDAFAGLM